MKKVEVAILLLNICIFGMCIAILTTGKEWYEPVTQAKKLYDSWKKPKPKASVKSVIVGGVRPKKENYTYTRNENKQEQMQVLTGQKQACIANLA